VIRSLIGRLAQPASTTAATTQSRHETRMQVNTSFQGAVVQVNANFATLPSSGLNYVQFAEATVPAKQLSVQVHNYNYTRLGN
jgi:hypothetical protein